MRAASNSRVRSGDGRAVEQGRRLAVQAGDNLGRAGGDRLERLGDAGQIGRQRAHAHHRAARACLALAVMMMRSGCILRGCLVMRMHAGMVARHVAVMGVACHHLMMHRHEIGQQHIIKARRGTAAPGKRCGRREHAEQIGEGDEPPHPDPHRSCQLPQHSADMLFARQRRTRRLQTNGKARFRQAASYRSAPRMPNIAARCLTVRRSANMVPAVHAPNHPGQKPSAFTPDSRQAWVRLVIALLIGSIGAVGMWAVVVVIPVVQAEFAATRGAVSLAFTLMMFGFGLGGVIAGKITDRFGIVRAMAISIAFLGIANLLAGLSTHLWQFVAAYFLIGLGTSATFAPLMAEASHWFERYRGLAVTIVASGNYVAGTVWPPLVNWGIQSFGWRTTHIGIGLVCVSLMSILVLVLR